MKLEVGKFYLNRNGRVVGPMNATITPVNVFTFFAIDKQTFQAKMYTEEGKFSVHQETEEDLMHEYTVSQNQEKEMNIAQQLRKELNERDSSMINLFIDEIILYCRQNNTGFCNICKYAIHLCRSSFYSSHYNIINDKLREKGFIVEFEGCSCQWTMRW